jgi:DnaJ-class molecular chaperone
MDGAKASLKDYYYILGVSQEATTAEIHQAFQDLHERFGPHVKMTGQDPDSMIKAYRDISEAYEVLSDPQRRAQYDQVSLPHLQKTHLRQLWGKVTGTQTMELNLNPAEETAMDVEVTLREAIKGGVKKIRIDENLPCQKCAGLKPMQRMSCQNCHGTGHTHQQRWQEIAIDPGVYDRMTLRKPGLGKFDPRVNKNGDLVVTIKIRQHQYFTCTVPVTFLEAILGGEIEVPTATGKVVMKIQPLTQSGKVYRLKGMGLAGADLLATIEVVVPKQISAEEVELFRKLQAMSTYPNPRVELLAKLKEEQQPPQT